MCSLSVWLWIGSLKAEQCLATKWWLYVTHIKYLLARSSLAHMWHWQVTMWLEMNVESGCDRCCGEQVNR